jgi:1-acyl-sn-glycerol-3-phosphate acyltransferase
VATLLTALATIIGSFCFGSSFWGYYPGMLWSRFLCLITWQRVSVQGREHLCPDQSYIFTPNHQGSFDIFLIYGYLGMPFSWVMKEELRRIPFVGAACEYAGHIYINRTNPLSIKQTLATAKERLQGGRSVVIFPEGSRTRTGKMGRFKRGAFLIATDLQLPVVPVTIDGSYTTLTKGNWFVKPNRLKLIIHPPLSTQGLSDSDIPGLLEQTRRVIAESLNETP